MGDTIKPRLLSAGADCSRVMVIDDGDQALTMMDARLEEAIIQTKARLVVLDLIQGFLGADVDMHRANEIRPLMKRVALLAEKYHCTAVLKDATTIVAREDDLVYINQSGNDGMATGGSGDVLAGMITGLLGGGLAAHEAAVHGVYLHGLAGDHARRDLGAYSMIASDIIAHIKDVTGGNYEPVL